MGIGKGRPHKKKSEQLYKKLTTSDAAGFGSNTGYKLPKKKRSY